MVVNSSQIERRISFLEKKNETSEFFLSEICLMVMGPGLMEYTVIPSVYNTLSCNSLIQLKQTI